MTASAHFPQRYLPLLFALPQLLALLLFFYWPALQAAWWSLHLVPPFGGQETYVGLANYRRLLQDPALLDSLRATLVFSLGGTLLAMGLGLVLAACLELRLRGRRLWRNLLVWPYAVSGATLGVIFQALASPAIGPLAWLNQVLPDSWAPQTEPWQAMALLIVGYAWCQMPFTFLMFVASLQAVPDDYLAAAALDGATSWQRLRDIQLPLIRPYLAFVFVIGLLDSLANSFGLVDTLTQGGPGDSTQILAYKIYRDGVVGLDLAGSSALSMLLLLLVVALSLLQCWGLARRCTRLGGSHGRT